MFQRQRIIADPELLFTGQDDTFSQLAIRDTLPYFLGAVDTDALAQRRELRIRRTELRVARENLEAATGESEGVSLRTRTLLEEARRVGLLHGDVIAAVDQDERATLASALQSRVSGRAGADGVSAGDLEDLAELNDRRAVLSDELRELRAERRLLRDRARQAAEFSGEVAEHKARLTTLSLLPEPGENGETDNRCPLCGAEQQLDPTTDDLRASLARASAQLSLARIDEPRLNDAIFELDAVEQDLRTRLSAIEEQVAALLRRREPNAPRALIPRELDRHRHRPAHRPELRPKPRPHPDRALRDQLGTNHPRVVAQLVALIGNEVEHTLNRALMVISPSTRAISTPILSQPT